MRTIEDHRLQKIQGLRKSPSWVFLTKWNWDPQTQKIFLQDQKSNLVDCPPGMCSPKFKSKYSNTNLIYKVPQLAAYTDIFKQVDERDWFFSKVLLVSENRKK